MINTHSIRTKIAAMLALTVITLAAVIFVNSQGSATATPNTQRPVYGMPACQHEDGHGQRLCYWDARTQGNGKGWSFVAHNGGQYVTYVLSAPRSCQALAQVGSWKSYGEDGVMIFNGRELAGMMIDDARTFGWGKKGLHNACAGWLYEYGRDMIKQ